MPSRTERTDDAATEEVETMQPTAGDPPAQERTMSQKKTKTARRAFPKKAATAAETAPVKAKKEMAAELVTFALRLPKSESAALHAAAGKGKASRVMKALAAAFVRGDRAAFQQLVEEARERRQ